jgi:hypothetical protein
MEDKDSIDKVFDKLKTSDKDRKSIDHFRKFADNLRRRSNLPPIDWYKVKDQE